MKKIISILLTAILLTAAVFAKDEVAFSDTELGITDSDCKNYAKNHEKISKDLDKLDASLENEIYIATDGLEPLNNVMEKNGISGPNAYYKVLGIYHAYAIITYENELKANPLAAAILKKSGADPVSSYKSSIGKKDYDTVKKNYKTLAVAFGDDVSEKEVNDPTIGGVIGNAIGGKKGSVLGKGVDSLIKKKGQSEKISDHINSDDE